MSDERLMIEAEPRTVIGKKVKQLRRDGLIPAVIYGQSEPQHVQLENGKLRRVLRVAGTTQLIDVKVGSKTTTVLTREIQQHVTRGDLIHIDFLEVDMKGVVTSDATLVPVGIAAEQALGNGVGILTTQSILIEANPNDLVSEIEVDMSLIVSMDTVLTAKDIVVPDGITILADPDTVIARFEIARAVADAASEDDAEEGAEDDTEL